MVVTAYVAVGSNIEPATNIPAALERLSRRVSVTGVSTLYRSEALDRPAQAAFVNGVWRIETSMDAKLLKFSVLRQIEAELGRVRTDDPYADRTIDLDIAVYGNAVINEPGLVVPDPDIVKRPFLAVPLLELAPDLCLPGSGLRLASVPAAVTAETLEPLPELTDVLRRKLHS